MTHTELKVMLQEGESYLVEFKESPSDNLDRELVAFANASGGQIFVGVKDNGLIQGIHVNNRVRSSIQNIANNCDPPVKITLDEMDQILVVKVKESDDKPHRCSSGFYLRVGPNTQKLKRDELLAFVKAEGKIRFDELLCRDFDFKRHFAGPKLRQYLKLAGVSNVLEAKKMLTSLGVLSVQAGRIFMNNTGVLFFSKHLENLYTHTAVVCALYKGVEKVDVLDRKDFNEDVASNIDEAMIFLERHLSVRYEITGALQRREVPVLPLEALREAVVNAVAHRDYFERGANIMVEIFDDRVEITNPGGLAKGFHKEDFGKRSVLRNPNIASLLYRMKYSEKMGTGIGRMRKLLREAGLPNPLC